VNRQNFLVQGADGRKTVTVLDFESASDCDEEKAFKEELFAAHGRGGCYVEGEDDE
jgi:hypothetical protein